MKLQRMKASDELGGYIKTCAVADDNHTVCGLRLDAEMERDGNEAMGAPYEAPLSECNCHECRKVLTKYNK